MYGLPKSVCVVPVIPVSVCCCKSVYVIRESQFGQLSAAYGNSTVMCIQRVCYDSS